MAETEVAITFEDQGSKARYIATLPGVDGEGELTLSKVSDALWIADHTGVPDTMRGLGVARALVAHLIADMRAQGRRIVPLCPYVRAEAEKHPDWSDVIER
ncbi:MAG: GNAT family N-acetyltransferase [Pseudomonadota bacterium]